MADEVILRCRGEDAGSDAFGLLYEPEAAKQESRFGEIGFGCYGSHLVGDEAFRISEDGVGIAG